MAHDWWDDPASQPYHQSLINGAAASGGVVTPQQLANQIGIESSFNPNAVSSTGAVGIAQILPSTAKDPGYGISSVDPTDPNAAIEFAGAYDGARGVSGYSGGEYNMSDVDNGSVSNTANASTDGSTSDGSVLDSLNPLNMLTSGAKSALNLFSGSGSTSSGSTPQNGLVAGIEAFGTRATLILLGLVFVAGAFFLLRPSTSDIVGAVASLSKGEK